MLRNAHFYGFSDVSFGEVVCYKRRGGVYIELGACAH